MGGYEYDPNGQAGYGDGGAGLIGALVQTGGMLYDSYQNRKQSEENQKRTIAANKSEAELAYSRQMQMIAQQNLYNSPQAQMDRFQAAGLNSHLIYGQGNGGNQQGIAQYHPADMSYNVEPRTYGSAIGSILPTLMAVGTWMQNMRLSESQIRSRDTGVDRQRQIMDYLSQANPELLKKLVNQNELFPYQKEAQQWSNEKAARVIGDLEREYQYKWGDKLFTGNDSNFTGMGSGIRKLQFLEQQSKNRLLGLSETASGYKNKLLEAQSSWSNFDITNPQALMQLVLSGVMGMAGQQIRLANRPKTKVSHELEEIMRSGRTKIRRRTYER